MKVLVGCEFSGVVRQAFRDLGCDAWSCDILPAEDKSPHHLQCDVREILDRQWDLAIFHPPCTYLSVSGLHWNGRIPGRAAQTEEALGFIQTLLDAPIPRIALENPVGCISTRIRKPTQVVQPWHFGDDASKATCLWLKNLPPLTPVNPLPGDARTRRANQTPSGQNKLGPSPDRWKDRSRTYPGIARAMAAQWIPHPKRRNTMPVTISITSASAEEALKDVQEFFKPRDESVDALLERVKGMLAGQGMTVEVKANGQAEPEEAPEEPRRKRGGQPKLTKDEAAAALAEETPAARKARCVAKLQELFAAGKKTEVKDILAQWGEGAKSFHAVPEMSFGPISDALEQLEA